MDDRRALGDLNETFIEACREGSWERLEPVLSPSFQYVDGATGDVWPLARYIDDLRQHPAPGLTIDQVVVHVDGHAAIVSARTSSSPMRYSRYVDAYRRRAGRWECYAASVWPLVP